MEEVKNPRHKKQTHYLIYGCPCEEHEKQQQEFEHWTRVMENSMYHGDYGCDLENCQCCKSNTEDDCLTHKKEEDNGSNSTPSKKLQATTIKDSKDKEPEWEILSFEEHKQEVLRTLSLMESMTQKETCPTVRALQMEAENMHWTTCKEKHGILTITTCERHWERKQKEVEQANHPCHDEFKYKCQCNYHYYKRWWKRTRALHNLQGCEICTGDIKTECSLDWEHNEENQAFKTTAIQLGNKWAATNQSL
ncbi:hypothetical protein LOZ65_006945 [Ophidiomyces ophidiicola]|nr:hypothetical protein LOZ65_006945 [Ophidiomyces ophidiicola]